MAISKTLILQGILGVTGLCASSASGIGLGLGRAFGGVQSDAPSTDDSSILPKPAEIIEVKENSDLGIPKECEGSCSLSAEQLKNLKFEQKGGEKIKFEDLNDADEFELIIEESTDSANYPRGKKYTLRPKTTTGTVTIKNIKEGDIVLGKDQEVLIREVIGGGKLEHLLEEVNGLGIPRRCKADEVTAGTPKTCDLTQHQLQKLNFERRGNEKITVEGLDEGNIVTLKIEDKESDKNNYPWGKKYTLRSATGDVTIKGVKEGDIILGKDQEVLIRETSEGGKLEHLLEELNELGIPKRCVGDQAEKPCDLKQKQLKDLKFEPKEGASISVEDGDDNSKFILEIEDKPSDTENYPRGKKYTIRSTGTSATIQNIKEGNIHIWKNQSVVVREKQGGGRLEMAPVEVDELGIPRNCEESCQLNEHQIKKLKFEVGDGGITVKGIDKAKTVTLTIENKSSDRDNYPKGKKYILKTTNRQQVTIKGLKDGDITIGGEGVVIREKQNEQKLEKAPEEIDHLGIPKRCNTGATCQLTKEELQRIKFETNGASSISIDGLDDGNTVGLKVETEMNVTQYPKKKKYTFTSKFGTVTIAGTKDKDIVLEQNKAVIFREIKEGNKLETYLNVLGIPRPWGGENIKSGSEPQTYCFSSDQVKDLRFKAFDGESGDVTVKGLDRGEKIKLKISWSDDENNYPDHKKYSFDNTKNENKDITISKGDQTVTIEKKKETWFGNKEGKLDLVEAKTKSQIAKENELAEVKKILKQIGLEKLEIGDFVSGGSSIKRKQTNVEFKSAEDLKKIQFKEFKGGSDSVSSLGNQGIRVYLDWEENTKKFPKNMKFSFENQLFSLGFNFWKGNTTIKIEQKTQATLNTKNVFKLEEDKGKWYLVRTNG